MKNKIWIAFGVLALILLINNTFSQKVTAVAQSQEYTYKVIQGKEITIISIANVKEKTLVIPERIDGYTVVCIGEYSAGEPNELLDKSSKALLEKVVFPNSVKKIEECCFYQCPNLKTVVMSENIREIGSYSFAECPKLSFIKLSQLSLQRIGESTFRGDKSLKTVVLGRNINGIGDDAFKLSGLETVTLPLKPTYCGEPFSYALKLKNVKIRNEAVHMTIPLNWFRNTKVKQLIIPNKLKSFRYETGKLLDKIIVKGKKTKLLDGRIGDQRNDKYKGKKFNYIPTKVIQAKKGSKAQTFAKKAMTIKKNYRYYEDQDYPSWKCLKKVKFKLYR